MHADHAGAVYGAGTYKGAKEPDKWSRVGLTRETATRIKAPLVAEAVASLECRVAQVVDLGASALVISQIVAAGVQPRHWSEGGWSWENGLRLLHHLSGPAFALSEKTLTASR
jgi:flavin reductase (DIM6/NTAB) family NADH-FMN oxidoreductase RutF